MKKIILYSVAFMMLGITGCSDWLDIRPESEVVLEDYWQTEAQATAVLSACYRGLSLDACVERMLVWGELRSDNLVEGSSTRIDMLRVLNVNITPTNAYANWGSFYSVINYCNTFLHYAPDVVKRDQNFTESKLRTFEAEALAIRALSYFYLVRAFKEVPLILTPSVNDTQDYNVAKSSEEEVLKQIIDDLLKAKSSVRADYGKGAYNKGRITMNAINAILADVYLWSMEYDNCIAMCDLILADEKLELVDDSKFINSVFSAGNSTESIFELQFDKDVQYNNTVNLMYGFESMPFGELSFPAYLAKESQYTPFKLTAQKESLEDLRYESFFGKITNGNGYLIYKYALVQVIENADGTFVPRYRPSSATVNWILYRLADVILMKAEALAVKDDPSEADLKEAVKLVNKTYLRSNNAADSLLYANYSGQSAVESLVMRERQRELMFEGKRWFDLMRLVRRKNDPSLLLSYLSPKLTGDNMQVKKLSVMNGLYMPVLQSELELNLKLTQNPFYEDTNIFN